MTRSAHSRGRLLFFAVWVPVSLLAFWYLAATYVPDPSEAPGVNIRWTAEVTDAQREALEVQYRLAQPQHQGSDPADRSPAGRTWSYRITDASTENIRQLVEDPAAEDTSNIDRVNFSVDAGEDAPGFPVVRLLFYACLVGLVPAALSTLIAVFWWTRRANTSTTP